MHKGRLEAFSDGVIAIIITIMVLELKVPHVPHFRAIGELWPVLLSYVLSFVNVGIYWNNHHHLMQAVKHVDGRILWANMHLLFWLSLMPFTTAWMGENHFALDPVALYGVVLAMSGVAYYLLVRALLTRHGGDSHLARAIGRDFKGKISVAIYLVAIPAAWIKPWIALSLYALVAVMWLVPDKRIERLQID
ncbi:MAG: DUF1211 domain-containing protein [Candidatus Eisenbacteria bacterium]|uniref:DUF1211 domain-containing protein n=1 Tax=Eiseniibacteriota bacterium TaxID=2212470 RepID=A0A849SLV0_UNCEI|nr:DUF1211 domain-containing protein [Candidatus Eisenbacteria bacterium]